MIFISDLFETMPEPISFLIASGIIVTVWWVVLFVGFVSGFRKEIDMGQYFRAMFATYNKTELRWLWRVLILTVEYILAMFALVIVKSAWYSAQAIRSATGKILFSGKKQKERLELEQLADK